MDLKLQIVNLKLRIENNQLQTEHRTVFNYEFNRDIYNY